MLLTLADGQGTGDENWSDWKESARLAALPQHLALSRRWRGLLPPAHHRARRRCTRQSRKQARRGFRGRDRRAFRVHAGPLFPDLLRSRKSSSTSGSSARSSRARTQDDASPLAPAVEWIPQPNRGPQRSSGSAAGIARELLARIAGSLSVAQLNILGADVFTRARQPRARHLPRLQHAASRR